MSLEYQYRNMLKELTPENNNNFYCQVFKNSFVRNIFLEFCGILLPDCHLRRLEGEDYYIRMFSHLERKTCYNMTW